MFSPLKYEAIYRGMLGPLARTIQVFVSDGSQYTAYSLTGHVSKYRESDLIPGGSIQMGDLKLIVLWEDLQALGIPKLGLKDRINIKGNTYSIIHWDEYTRKIGTDNIAVEITIRGGGLSVLASVFVYRVTGSGDQRITGDGDRRGIKEAASG